MYQNESKLYALRSAILEWVGVRNYNDIWQCYMYTYLMATKAYMRHI